jgi:hypothetical protein
MLSIVAWLMGSTIGRYIVAGVTGAAIIGLAVARVFAKGRAYEQSKVTEQKLSELRNATKANEEVSRLSRADRLKYLDGWVRDGD